MLLYEQCATLLARACHADPDPARAARMGARALQYQDRAIQLRPPGERAAITTVAVGAPAPPDFARLYRMGQHSLAEARELHEGMRYTEVCRSAGWCIHQCLLVVLFCSGRISMSCLV